MRLVPANKLICHLNFSVEFDLGKALPIGRKALLRGRPLDHKVFFVFFHVKDIGLYSKNDRK